MQKSLREKGERRVVGQQGHPGIMLRLTLVPDVIVDHKVVVCNACGAFLVDVPVLGMERWQVYDIPPVWMVVRERRAETKQCLCCGLVLDRDQNAAVTILRLGLQSAAVKA